MCYSLADAGVLLTEAVNKDHLFFPDSPLDKFHTVLKAFKS